MGTERLRSGFSLLVDICDCLAAVGSLLKTEKHSRDRQKNGKTGECQLRSFKGEHAGPKGHSAGAEGKLFRYCYCGRVGADDNFAHNLLFINCLSMTGNFAPKAPG